MGITLNTPMNFYRRNGPPALAHGLGAACGSTGSGGSGGGAGGGTGGGGGTGNGHGCHASGHHGGGLAGSSSSSCCCLPPSLILLPLPPLLLGRLRLRPDLDHHLYLLLLSNWCYDRYDLSESHLPHPSSKTSSVSDNERGRTG